MARQPAASSSASRGSEPRSGERPSELRPPRAKRAEQLAAEIEREIIERGWKVSESLGTEEELLGRHRVSRAVLREAIRILEHRMVARMKPGPGGGLIVAEPREDFVWDVVDLYLEYRGVTAKDIFEARLTLESATVELAARRIDEEGIASLRDRVARELAGHARDPGGDVSVFDADMRGDEFHALIADLSGNPAIQIFVRTLSALTWQRYRARVAKKKVSPGHGVGRDHVGIAEAIISGDAALARARMLRHLEDLAGLIGLSEVAEPRSRRRR
jgi:DNA-binding FadR family transcriptional regulator